MKNENTPKIVVKKISLQQQISMLTRDVKVILTRDPIFNPKDGKTLQKKTNKSQTIVKYQSYSVGEILWAKMKGFPLWPCKVMNN